MNTATVRCHPGAQLNNGINASGDANLCISATHGAACPAAKSCAQTWQSVWELAAPQPGLLFSIYLLVVLYIAYMQYDIHECFICVSGNRYVWALPVGLSGILSSVCSLMCPVYVFVYSVLNCAWPGDISDKCAMYILLEGFVCFGSSYFIVGYFFVSVETISLGLAFVWLQTVHIVCWINIFLFRVCILLCSVVEFIFLSLCDMFVNFKPIHCVFQQFLLLVYPLVLCLNSLLNTVCVQSICLSVACVVCELQTDGVGQETLPVTTEQWDKRTREDA